MCRYYWLRPWAKIVPPLRGFRTAPLNGYKIEN